MHKPSEERKDYYCLRCKAQYTTMEVLDSVGPYGFICHRCGANLEERDDRNAGTSTGHEKQSKLAGQLERLLKLLQQIDNEDIPNNDFEAAFAVAVPVQRNELVNPTRNTEPIQSGRGLPAAVKGLNANAIVPLEVSLTTTSEKTTVEQAAETRRKVEAAIQNSMPIWHRESTVTGESTALGLKQGKEANIEDSITTSKAQGGNKKETNVLKDELTKYYNQMIQEKATEARQALQADHSSGDEDEGDFEDVSIRPSTNATPSSSMSIAANEIKNGDPRKGSRKRGSESGSSASGTNISTPAAASDEREGPAVKKLKTESRENGVESDEPGTGDAGDGDSDGDEEDEFEDAL
jgi:transcription initiation factor TFIIE subunit alpha